jgi:hypothetical protein
MVVFIIETQYFDMRRSKRLSGSRKAARAVHAPAS